jgi:hypothetical protein
LVDLTTDAAAAPLTTGWEEIDFPDSGQIAGMILYNNSMVAFGRTEEGAQVWLSVSGIGWRVASRLETPETTQSSIDHAVTRNGGLVALGWVEDGIGLWTARNMSHWVYHGQVAEMAGHTIVGLAGGDELMAIGERGGSYHAWTSPDGLAWVSAGDLEMLGGASVNVLAASDEWHFAGGSERCEEPQCRPVIYRSRDGLVWEPGSGALAGVLDSEAGTVVDIKTHGDGLIALGQMGHDSHVALWFSTDGASWTRLAEDEPLFQPTSTTVEVDSLSTGPDPTAVVAIDGNRHQVTVGTEIATHGGRISITAIDDSGILLTVDGSARRLARDGTLITQRAPSGAGVATQGRRIVIGGHLSGSEKAIPTVWSSTDNGLSWERRSIGAASGRMGTPVLNGANIAVAAGPFGNSPDLWHSTWDTSRTESEGLELVHLFVEALNSGEPDSAANAIPTRRDGAAIPVFHIPSLGSVDMRWWDESGMIDIDSVAATVSYLDAMHTSITLGDCTTRMLFGDVDSLRVTCDVTATSDLVSTLTNGHAEGTINAVVEDGVLESLTELPNSPTQRIWQMLTNGTEGHAADDRTTLVGVDATGRPTGPTFTAESAEVHLRLARDFVAGLLRPGETRVVETALGTMEWRWLDLMPVPVFSFNSVVHSDNGFIGLGQGEPGSWTEDISLWSSRDGVTWEQGIAAPEVESMWNLHAFRGGFLAVAWRADEQVLLLHDGTEWSEIEIPGADGLNTYLMDVATSGDSIFAVTGSWSEDRGPDAQQAWVIGMDNIPRPAALPPTPAAEYDILELVGSEDGFVLSTVEYGTAETLAVWHSTDGMSWTAIGGSTSIDDAAFVWNLQQHRGRYFIVGEGAEVVCSPSAEGEICEQPVGLWTSPDGGAWHRVVTVSGERVASYEIGSGPLGLVAVAMEVWDTNLPRALYLSPDGDAWHRAGNLALLHPDVSWWYVQQPVVGDDVIVIPGAAYEEFSGVDSDTPFLIVGRLLDG